MRRNRSKVMFLVALLGIVGCSKSTGVSSYIDPDAGKLTNEKAQIAIQRWMSSGTVAVQGIQEVPQENAARVDITFTNFKFKDTGFQRNYSGPGIAIFAHYNDGRWVLNKISTSQGFNSAWWNNINVEVR